MTEMTYTETLVVTHCWCGIALAIPSNLHRFAHDEGRDLYCPIGHKFVYSDSYKKQYEKMLARVAEEQRRVKATRDLLHAEERSHVATRGHLTRARKRAAAGVCPCCNRTFQDVSRHMKTKHPDFEAAAAP